ncbi:MAG: hypothetical protein E7404_01065 [Ruminococcaceae bacterium]|nr:hypothetical protein [Oscillospiraceae bacterium]
MKNAKRSISLLVVFAMIFCSMSLTAFAEEIEVTDYETLMEAIGSANDEDVIKLTSDITATGKIDVSGKKLTIDLNGKTLYLTVSDTHFNNDASVTISGGENKDGKIDISGVDSAGDCILGIGDRSTKGILTLENVNIVGDGYNSGFAVFMIYSGDELNALNIEGGSINLSNENSSAGGVIKNQNGAGNQGIVNITGTLMELDNISRGISGTTAVFDDVDLTITGGDNGINGSALTIKNGCQINISGGTGRAITITDYDVTIENSTLNLSDMGEAEIRFKTNNNLAIDESSSLSECNVVVDTSATINSDDVTDGAVVKAEEGEISVTQILGEGTEASPYLIGTKEELEMFRDNVNNGNTYSGKYIKLTSDIDLSEEENWTPIGLSNTIPFLGYFDGGNFTISNLTINNNTNDMVGLFGYVKGSGMTGLEIPTIQNLKLTNVNVMVDDASSRVAALVGNSFVGVIKNVFVKGNVSGGKWTGGIAGNCYAYFDNCSFEGTVTSNNQAGGIAGAGDARSYNCYVAADITAKWWAGGIVGNGQEGASAVNCYVKGKVTTLNNYVFGVGGIAGVAGHGYASSIFKDNYFDGEVYIGETKVDTPVIGVVNSSNDDIKTTVSGNSWNSDCYPSNLDVAIVGADSFENSEPTYEEYKTAAKETLERNHNLVMLESDLYYIDAENADDVTIMSFSEVTSEDIATAIENPKPVRIGGVGFDTLSDAVAAVKDNEVIVLLTNNDEVIEVNKTIKFVIDTATFEFAGEIKAGNRTTITPVTVGEKTTYECIYTALSGDDGAIVSAYTVKFNTNGGSKIESIKVKRNMILDEPENPKKDGYEFAGWYKDENLSKEYDFSSKIMGNITLYAKWIENSTSAGSSTGGSSSGSSSGSIVQIPEKTPDTSITQPQKWDNPFDDVSENDWYYEAVEYVYKNEFLKGVNDNTFAPSTKINRAMLVTVLYRMEGEPDVTDDSGFADVEKGSYYEKAVIWAKENGIVNGIAELEFAPQKDLTREQIAAILYRYAEFKNMDTSFEEKDVTAYDDYDLISEYALPAIKWANAKGLINGRTENTLNPSDSATRAEISAVLLRFMQSK